MEKQSSFSDYSLKLLEYSGWYSSRSVFNILKLPKNYEIFPEAIRVLDEFGLLNMGVRGPGIECAKSRVNMNPLVAEYEDDKVTYYETITKRPLYPLGEIDEGTCYLVIDIEGKTYALGDDLWLIDHTFELALERLLVGRRSIAQLTP